MAPITASSSAQTAPRRRGTVFDAMLETALVAWGVGVPLVLASLHLLLTWLADLPAKLPELSVDIDDVLSRTSARRPRRRAARGRPEAPTAVVTGGCGMLGSAVVRRLLACEERRFKVLVVDVTPPRSPVPGVSEYVQMDLATADDSRRLDAVLASHGGADVVVHTAGVVNLTDNAGLLHNAHVVATQTDRLSVLCLVGWFTLWPGCWRWPSPSHMGGRIRGARCGASHGVRWGTRAARWWQTAATRRRHSRTGPCSAHGGASRTSAPSWMRRPVVDTFGTCAGIFEGQTLTPARVARGPPCSSAPSETDTSAAQQLVA
uniref:3-beta hydroxysteroid dehydrogenase/isomerase domain-containing protein n=1 Tax=Alexandrium monilatum TaxID=311494 RepID=A0A7S4Q9Q1_9DINO